MSVARAAALVASVVGRGSWVSRPERASLDRVSDPRASERTLIFLHVPKTAGTTLNRIIDSQYNPLRVYSIPGGHRVRSIERFKRLPDARRSKLLVLKGHMGFGLHRFFGQPTTYLTMLREPVDQVVSSYYYALSNRFHPLHNAVRSGRITLERFLDLAPWGNNLQSKLIGGIPMAEVNPPAALAAARRGEIVTPEHFAGRHCAEDILRTAKENLERHFSVVGLTERFEESLALMMLEYGWRAPTYQNFRRSSKRPADLAIDAASRARIERYNAFDMELYEFGEGLFRAAVERHRDGVARTVEQLRGGPQPGAVRARGRAALAWGRMVVSLARSSL